MLTGHDLQAESVMHDKITQGDVIVLRYEGSKATPACARCWRRRRR